MVITRSQAKSREVLCTAFVDTRNAPGGISGKHGVPVSPPEECLGRGCRVPRPALPSYDSLYIAKALSPRQRRHSLNEEIQVNTRYPERDAAKRAVLKLGDTLSMLNGNRGPDSSGSDSVSVNHPSGRSNMRAPSTPEGALETNSKRSSQQYKSALRKRHRESSSIDSSISDESLRRASQDRGLENEKIVIDDSSSDILTDESVHGDDNERVAKNVKRCVTRNLPINHCLRSELKRASLDTQRDAPSVICHRHKRSMEDIFLGFGKINMDYGNGNSGGQGPPRAENHTALGDITPLCVDGSVTFEKVGGLPEHIVMLREMVLFPLLYPEMLQQMNLSPPRGVLFVGSPGTGKTLMARALANEGMRHGNRKITFFMRKGGDILSKWVGESERQLTLLFQEARRRQPSIIFFDELDGLVPVRQAKSEQAQAAIVATLLALIDGLDDRGQVIIIGATNRPDTIDPALRRPGRFDRELYFPLPDMAARRHILDIVLKPMLPADHPDRNEILQELAIRCSGWSGAEIQSVCTEAGLNRLRTAVPQIYTTSKRLKIPAGALTITKEDFFIAAHRIKLAVRRAAAPISSNLDEHLEHMFYTTQAHLLSRVAAAWPSASAILAQERRDCSSSLDAVQGLSCFPIIHTASPLILFLTMEPDSGESDYEGSEFAVSKAAIVLVKGLPSIRTFILNLPNMVVDRDAAGLLAAHSNDGIGRVGNNSYGIEEVKSIDGCTHFDAGHISSCVAAVRQFNGPSLVILQGLEEWLEDHGSVGEGGIDVGGGETCDERRRNLRSLCYYINCLRDADTLIVIPTVNRNVTPIFSERNKLSKQIRSITLEVPHKPSESDLRRSLSYLFRVVELALKKCAPVDLEMLPEDPAPPLPPSLEEIHTRRREELELWRRVEYRRKQLRYVLIRWLSQYLASKKFSILISADLDMTPSHDLYAHWQQHTRGRRIGLGDIMKKLERGEYNAISQYHDDIDMLVHNVRTFFRTRTVFDNRYRIRVLELKEVTVLNLYKINRNVVLFCEMHKDLACPSFSPLPSEASEEVPTATATLPASTSNNTATQRKTVQKPPRRRYGGARRRRNVRCARRQNSVPTTTAEPMRSVEAEVVLIGDASIGDDGDEADNDAEASGGVENEGVKHGSSQEEEEGNSDGSWKKEESSCAIEAGRADSSVGASPEEERKNGGLTASGVVLKGDANAVGERLDYPTAAEDTSEWWVGAVLPSLRHLSFLQIHLVVQTAMRKLEMEVDNRRKQRRETHEPLHCTSDMSSNETSSMSPGSFFKWMIENSVQELKAVVG